MSTCNSRPESRSAWFGVGGLTGWVLALAVIGMVIGAPKAYSQVPGAVSPGGSAQPNSLMDEIIKGGPPGAWIPHPENPWLQGLRITGLLQNTTGIWVNPHGIRTNSGNSAQAALGEFYSGETATNFLATERNLMQVDTNYDLDGRNHFFLRWWGVYEPAYDFEQYYRGADAEALNAVGRQTGCFPGPTGGAAVPGVDGFTHCTASAASDFYNQVGFREAWWRLSMGPLRLFTGRQIVTWGESLAFRIADVVNPQDLSWNFGFANLEQSRLPQYMIHPILELPEFGWLTQNFVEGIWEPPIQALDSDWIWTDTPDHRYSGAGTNGGSVDILAPFGGRFDLNTQTPYGGPVPFPNPTGNTIPGTPTALAWAAYPQASFDSNFLPTNEIARWRFPTSQMTYSNEGIRFHALIDQLVEGTLLYWHGHQLLPAGRLQILGPPVAAPVPDPRPVERIVEFFPQFNDVGFTGNMPINIPGQLGSMFPFVLRSEGVFQDHTPFANRVSDSGIKYSGTLNTLVALDADQIYAPWLTSTGGSLTVNLEWNNYTILSPSRFNEYAPFVYQQARHNEESFIFAASTSWWWQSIAPQWVSVYNPDGNTFLLFPNIALVPPWTSQYFMKLQYIQIISNNIQDDYAGGQFKGKNFVLAQFQWNFNML
ncbi:MAG TPA: DUF1302 family protein [Candidatus Binataceae bacterium]|nr:DUF1302 family protein [Candidatus Binataceae bacterium]